MTTVPCGRERHVPLELSVDVALSEPLRTALGQVISDLLYYAVPRAVTLALADVPACHAAFWYRSAEPELLQARLQGAFDLLDAFRGVPADRLVEVYVSAFGALSPNDVAAERDRDSCYAAVAQACARVGVVRFSGPPRP